MKNKIRCGDCNTEKKIYLQLYLIVGKYICKDCINNPNNSKVMKIYGD